MGTPIGTSGVRPVTKSDYVALATFIGKGATQRVQKGELPDKVVREAGQLFENRDYAAAYDRLKPVYDKIVSDMQRVLARDVDLEAKRLATEMRKSVAAARTDVVNRKAHAQQVIDQLDRLRRDLEGRPMVRYHLKRLAQGGGDSQSEVISDTVPPAIEEAATTAVNSANETRVEMATCGTSGGDSTAIEIDGQQYESAEYIRPRLGAMYIVRDKLQNEHVVRVIAIGPDGDALQLEVFAGGRPSKKTIQLTVDKLAKEAAKGRCNSLIPAGSADVSWTAASSNAAVRPEPEVSGAMLRLDIQNFGRCCGDIARANLKFSTQLIKDVGDGPFRAGKYEQAFLNFEQLAVGFHSAVAASRREIADGRRALTAEKGNLSGKEIQDRTAAYVRSEQLIHTAEREFSTILEGLRMYLRASQS
jgi:hypothetical protein